MVVFDKDSGNFHDIEDPKEAMVSVLSGRYLYAHEHAALSFEYAKYVLESRFPLGEPAIAANGFLSYLYAVWVLHGRFFEGEPAIIQSDSLLNYIREFDLRLYNGKLKPFD